MSFFRRWVLVAIFFTLDRNVGFPSPMRLRDTPTRVRARDAGAVEAGSPRRGGPVLTNVAAE
jgi:hypothetical protein